MSIVAAANQPSDVLVRKVNDALYRSRKMSEEYRNILAHRVAVRVYTHSSEMSYFISFTERQYEQNLLRRNTDEESGVITVRPESYWAF